MALILLAGLKSLPTDVLEAAEADGATPAQRFRIVIFPMLLPAVFLALVLAHDGRLPRLRHRLRHHQRRAGRRHRRVDDLRGEAGPAVLQYRLRLGDLEHDDRLHRDLLGAVRASDPARRPPRQRARTDEPPPLGRGRSPRSAWRSSRSSASFWCRSPGSSPPPTSRRATSSAFRRPSRSRRRSTISAASSAISISSACVEIEPHHLARLGGAVASDRRSGRLCAGALQEPPRRLGRLFLLGRPHRAAGRDADPVLSDDARHPPSRHVVGGDPHQHDAQRRLRRLDDVLLFPLAAEGAGGGGADRRLHALRQLLPRRAAARRARASSRARYSASCSRGTTSSTAPS